MNSVAFIIRHTVLTFGKALCAWLGFITPMTLAPVFVQKGVVYSNGDEEATEIIGDDAEEEEEMSDCGCQNGGCGC